MGVRAKSLLLLSLAIVATACGPMAEQDDNNGSSLHGDSGIRGPAFTQIVQSLNLLGQQQSTLVETINYGQSPGRRPLTLLKISNRGVAAQPGAPAVLIAEAIHGDEFLNTALRLPEKFLAQASSTQSGFSQFLAKGGAVYIVPVHNPDGYEARTRGNKVIGDLNRDYPLTRANKTGLTQPETRDLQNFIDKDLAASGRKMKLTWDYHCCIGALLYPWGYARGVKLEVEALAKHRSVAQITQTIFGYKHGTCPEVLDYVALGATDDYYYEKYGSLSFVFEGVYAKEAQQLDKHVQLWDTLFAQVAREAGGASTPVATQQTIALKLVSGADKMVSFQVGVESGAQAVVLCLNGDCTKNRVELKAGPQTASRKIFTSSPVAVQSDQTVRFEAITASGVSQWTRVIRVKAK